MIRLLVIVSFFIGLVVDDAFAEKKLRVGLALPLSGIAADYGQAYKNGLELGIADHPALVDKLTFFYEDHQYDNRKTLSAVQKLDAIDHVNLIYVWGFTPSDTVAPIAKTIHAPLLVASINPTSLDKPTVLNIESPLSKLMEPLLKKIIHARYERIAFVVTQLGALVQGADIIKAGLPANVVVSSDVFESSTTDFRSLITRLKHKRVQAVGLFLAPEQMKLFIDQARAQGFNPNLYGGNTFNDAAVLRHFVNTKTGPHFVDSFTSASFAERYEERFHSISHINEAARGYFLGQLLAFVQQNTKDYSAESIIHTLHAFPSGNGPAGEYGLVEDGFGWHVDFKPQLYTIVDGRVVAGNTKPN